MVEGSTQCQARGTHQDGCWSTELHPTNPQQLQLLFQVSFSRVFHGFGCSTCNSCRVCCKHHLTEETQPGLAKTSIAAGMENTEGKGSGTEFQQTKNAAQEASPGISPPKGKAWLARGACEPPEPPLRGEFNSLPAGSLTLVCSEARNYKDLQGKKRKKKQPTQPRHGLTIAHRGLSGAAPSLCPQPSPSWAQPAGMDGNLLQSIWSSQDGILGSRATCQLHLLPAQGRRSSPVVWG